MTKVKETRSYRRHEKPPFSYITMIAMAIKHQQNQKATLQQINDWLMNNFIFFRGEYNGWKNSVRHNLSLNDCFTKILRDPSRPWGKDNFWTISTNCSYIFKDGVFRRRKKIKEESAMTVGSQLDRQIETYENRLHKEMVKYNRMLKSNEKLRVVIQHMRGEQKKFEEKNKKLEKILGNKLNHQDQMVDHGNHAYDTQADDKQKRAGLDEKNTKDLQQHSLEFKELQRHLDHEDTTKHFMEEKSEDRSVLAQLEINRRQVKASTKNEIISNRKLALFERSFKQIFSIYGNLPVEQLLYELEKSESESFALYNYINETNKKIEDEIEIIAKFKMNIENSKNSTTEYLAKMNTKCSEVNASLNVSTASLAIVSKQFDDQNNTFNILCGGIQTIFNRIGCDKKLVLRMLGDNVDITTENILAHLGLIETQANRLLAVFFKSQQENSPDILQTPNRKLSSSNQNRKATPIPEDVMLPPAIEEPELYDSALLVDPSEIRGRVKDSLKKRDELARRTTLSDDYDSKQQRKFLQRNDTRRMTLF